MKPTNRDYFDVWFAELLYSKNQTCLIRDILRASKEKLWEEWQKADPYGFKPQSPIEVEVYANTEQEGGE